MKQVIFLIYFIFSKNLNASEYIIKTGEINSLRKILEFKIIKRLPLSQLLVIRSANKLDMLDSGIKIERNSIYKINDFTPNDSLYQNQWSMNSPKGSYFQGNWQRIKKFPQTIVAVIDTGVDIDHNDLKENIFVNLKEINGKPGIDDDNNGYIDDINGVNLIQSNSPPYDDHGHGTHCAGIIGAKGNNDIGISGVNWNAKILPVKAFNKKGRATKADLIESIEYAIKLGAKVINASYGSFEYSEFMKETLLKAHKAGVLIVAGAGNNSTNNDLMNHFPSGYSLPNIISVGASNSKGHKADFSNFGIKTVDIIAPGEDIVSTLPDNKYGNKSGTSMSTPIVSGTLSLFFNVNAKEGDHVKIKNSVLRASDTAFQKYAKYGFLNFESILNGSYNSIYSDQFQDWKVKMVKIETDHPYEANQIKRWNIKIPEAKKIAIYFDKFQMERDFDRLEILDKGGNILKKLSGNDIFSSEFSSILNTNELTLVFYSDKDHGGYGFQISKLYYK